MCCSRRSGSLRRTSAVMPPRTGYLDAPLGPLAYRAMVECKTGSANGFVTQPNIAEAAKYREAYGAAYCLLIGPAFGAQTTLASDLRTHGVSAWTVEDLAAVVQAECACTVVLTPQAALGKGLGCSL